MEVNLKGTYLVTWHAVRTMEESGGGSIINIASINGLVGYPIGLGGGFDAYVPSKGWRGFSFTKNLAIDYGKKNIRVNCILSGAHRHQSDREFLDNPERREWCGAALPDGAGRSPRRDSLRGTFSGVRMNLLL